MAKPKYCFIYVTCPNTETAEKIAHHMVQTELAACANIFSDMRSVYKWKGRIESSDETVLILKTQIRIYKNAELEIKKLHPYDCPCIVQLPITDGQRQYLNWIKTNTGAKLQARKALGNSRKKLRSK